MSLMGAGGVSLKKVQSLIDSAVSSINSKITSVTTRVTTLEGKHPVVKLLWKNSSPTADFAAKSVSISGLSGYSMVIILAMSGGSSSSALAPACIATTTHPSFYLAVSTTTTYMTSRKGKVNFSSNSITFQAANNGSGTDNGVCIPVEVYGVKL